MLIKTEALVLHALRYGESKLIVDAFTREQGRLSLVTSVSSTPKGRIKKLYFQPLTLLQVECDVRQQWPLQKLKDAALLCPTPTLLGDPSKLSISLFLAEFLYHALRGEQQNVPLYDYLKTSLLWLDSRHDDYANFHLVLLMHVSRFLGFYPNLEPIQAADGRAPEYFDLRSAAFCTAVPLHRDFLQPEEAQLVRQMMRMDYATMHLFRLNRRQRNRLVEVALRFYRLHLPDFPDLRSLEVLREVWQPD